MDIDRNTCGFSKEYYLKNMPQNIVKSYIENSETQNWQQVLNEINATKKLRGECTHFHNLADKKMKTQERLRAKLEARKSK